jgi:predicted dehydrogenase
MKWGVIGLGKISTTFTREFKFIENATIYIVGSRKMDKAKEFASIHNIPAYGNYDDVVTNNEIDAIYIGTPHSDHYEWVKKALQNGKHVLCEKSITINEKQFLELKALALAKQLMLMDAMWTYFLPATKQAKKWIEEGIIGPIKYTSVEFGYNAPYVLENRLYNPDLAGGALLDIGVYLIYSTFNFLGDEYVEMICRGELAETGVDQSVSIIFDYGDKKSNTFCTIAHKLHNSSFIYGMDGYIELPLFWRATKAIRYNNANEIVEIYDDARQCHGFEYQIKHFMDCVDKKLSESPIVTHQRTQKVMQSMDEIRKRLCVIYPQEK